jgi:hypothetical protein
MLTLLVFHFFFLHFFGYLFGLFSSDYLQNIFLTSNTEIIRKQEYTLNLESNFAILTTLNWHFYSAITPPYLNIASP